MTSTGSQIGQFIERKQAERAMQESEARKAAILESALDCIITMDDKGRIIEFNPAAERTFGYRRDQVIGNEMAVLIIPPALREKHRQGLRQFLAEGEGPILGKRIELIAMRDEGIRRRRAGAQDREGSGRSAWRGDPRRERAWKRIDLHGFSAVPL